MWRNGALRLQCVHLDDLHRAERLSVSEGPFPAEEVPPPESKESSQLRSVYRPCMCSAEGGDL